MSPTPELPGPEHPHIEGPHGVWIPPRLTEPEYLDYHHPEFNFWQQSPFDLVELQLTPADAAIFADEIEPGEQARLLILLAVEYVLTPHVLDTEAISRIRNSRSRNGVYNRAADDYLKHFGAALNPNVAEALRSRAVTDQKIAAIVQVAEAVERVRLFLAPHAYWQEYVKEMVLHSDHNFAKDGTTLPKRMASQAQISTYAWYRSYRLGVAQNESARWTGLYDNALSDGSRR